MKNIYTYSRGSITTSGVDKTLFTGGREGLIVTAVTNLGLTLKLWAEGDNLPVTLTGSLVGLGLGWGDKLLANGTGSLAVTFWGSLDSTVQIVNTNQLEVIVGAPVDFAKAGTVGGVAVSASSPIWMRPGIYTDYAFSLDANGKVIW
jgi:hypothetical protein